MLNLESIAQNNIIDYGTLMDALSSYKAPHQKINRLLSSNQIIRVKKGLYVLGKELRKMPINKLHLANLIYGPSYVSQEYALQYYSLIPEKVEMVTSMTMKKNKLYKTPVGPFQYQYINSNRYSVGVDMVSIGPDVNILMASPEKAICDCIYQIKELATAHEVMEHLVENMRIEQSDLYNLDKARLRRISSQFHNKITSLLCKSLETS